MLASPVPAMGEGGLQARRDRALSRMDPWQERRQKVPGAFCIHVVAVGVVLSSVFFTCMSSVAFNTVIRKLCVVLCHVSFLRRSYAVHVAGVVVHVLDKSAPVRLGAASMCETMRLSFGIQGIVVFARVAVRRAFCSSLNVMGKGSCG